MAELTGVLQADFSAFYTAVTKAEAHLRDFESGAGKVEKSLGRMVDKFSGRQLIQDATLAVEAVERLGGASKLTEKELAALTSQSAEAAKKLRAMGEAVPENIQKYADASQDVETSIGSMVPTVGRLASALGIAFSIEAVVGFGRQILDTAERLTELSIATGTSTTDLQTMEAIAGQTGTTLDNLVGAVTTLQTKFDDPAAQKRLQQMGIELDKIKAANYYEQLKMIAEGLKRIPDEADRVRAQVALMGTSAKQNLGTMKSDFDELEKGIVKSTAGSIKALNDLKDAMSRGTANATNFATTGIAGVVIALKSLNEKGFQELAKQSLELGGPSGPIRAIFETIVSGFIRRNWPPSVSTTRARPPCR